MTLLVVRTTYYIVRTMYYVLRTTYYVVCTTKRVIVTPAVYPRLDEPLHFDIQSTGQKSHCVNINL